MHKLHFRPLTLESNNEILGFLHSDTFSISDITFGNLYIWKHAREISYATYASTLLIQTRYARQDPYFFFPIGSMQANKLEALHALESYAHDNGFSLCFERIENHNLALLKQAFPTIIIEPTPNHFDYIYSVEELIQLSGRKFHKKKNHLNNFLQRYDWELESITSAHANELAQVARFWLDSNPAKSTDLELEYQGICAALEKFDDIGLQGVLVRAREKNTASATSTTASALKPVVAFSFGEAINDKMAVIHIEKASPHTTGAYQIINQQLLSRHFATMRYVNREEDLGIPGLRQAKRGYNPVFMVEKFRAHIPCANHSHHDG